MSQLQQADRKQKGVNSFFLPSFAFFCNHVLNRLGDAHSRGEGHFTLEFIDSNANLIRKHSYTHPEIMLNLGMPVKLTPRINHHSP